MHALKKICVQIEQTHNQSIYKWIWSRGAHYGTT